MLPNYYDPHLSRVDNAVSKALQKIWPAKPLGQLLPQRNGGLKLCINLQATANELKQSRIDPQNADYQDLTQEARIRIV